MFQAMDDDVGGKIEEQGGFMASQGLRVIALAVRPLTADQATTIKDSNNSNLCEVYSTHSPLPLAFSLNLL